MSEVSKAVPNSLEQPLLDSSNPPVSAEIGSPPVSDVGEGDPSSEASLTSSGTDPRLLGGLTSEVIIADLPEQVEESPDLQGSVATYPIPCGLPVLPPAHNPQPDNENN